MSEEAESNSDDEALAPGEEVYDEDGQIIGQVTGYTADGVEVKTTANGSTGGDTAETVPGQEFGSGYLMWRCTECGEMGDLDDGIPDSCPACGASEEAIAAIEED